jgi:16S rRNA processing protein RimM
VNKIKIRRISGVQGLRGEVKMFHDSGEYEALKRLTSLFLGSGSGKGSIEYTVENMRMHKRTPIYKLEGIEDREAAEALVGLDVFSDEEESRPEGEGAWFASELVGMRVMIASPPSVPHNGGEGSREDEGSREGEKS